MQTAAGKEPYHQLPTSENQKKWLDYLDARVGTYEYRTLRYRAVWDKLLKMGLEDHDLIVDIGAGMCDFARYIYSAQAFDGRYLPVDAAIDGTDLELWSPSGLRPEFYVCIETIEHLRESSAHVLMGAMQKTATKGVVLTTPNPTVYNVQNLDPSHKCHFFEQELRGLGFETETQMLFGKDHDTIVAWSRSGSLMSIFRRFDEGIAGT